MEPDIIHYKNISPNQNDNNIIIPFEIYNIYKIRLTQTKDTLKELSKLKWPNVIISKNVFDLKLFLLFLPYFRLAIYFDKYLRNLVFLQVNNQLNYIKRK